MTVTVWPQPAHRNEPDAVVACAGRVLVCSTSAIVIQCAHTPSRGNAATGH